MDGTQIQDQLESARELLDAHEDITVFNVVSQPF